METGRGVKAVAATAAARHTAQGTQQNKGIQKCFAKGEQRETVSKASAGAAEGQAHGTLS